VHFDDFLPLFLVVENKILWTCFSSNLCHNAFNG